MRKSVRLIPLTGALAALSPVTQAAVTSAEPAAAKPNVSDTAHQTPTANMFYNLDDALMGIVATHQADGTVVAQHSSHASHASHYSGR